MPYPPVYSHSACENGQMGGRAVEVGKCLPHHTPHSISAVPSVGGGHWCAYLAAILA